MITETILKESNKSTPPPSLGGTHSQPNKIYPRPVFGSFMQSESCEVMSIVHQAVDSILCQRHKVFVGRQEGKDAELRKKTRQCDKRKKREKQDVDWQEW